MYILNTYILYNMHTHTMTLDFIHNLNSIPGFEDAIANFSKFVYIIVHVLSCKDLWILRNASFPFATTIRSWKIVLQI